MRRLLVGLYALVFVAMAAATTTFFVQTRGEYQRLQEIDRVANERLQVAQGRLLDQEVMLQRMRSDPQFVETVIRRRLGYAKPDELVFRFEN